jgi:hypothetical protein
MAYSVFDGEEYKSLDSIAFNGKCVFYGKDNKFFGSEESVSYLSDVFESPTWGQAFIESMKAQQYTLDFHHCYLEDIRISGYQGDITILSFVLGS